MLSFRQQPPLGVFLIGLSLALTNLLPLIINLPFICMLNTLNWTGKLAMLANYSFSFAILAWILLRYLQGYRWAMYVITATLICNVAYYYAAFHSPSHQQAAPGLHNASLWSFMLLTSLALCLSMRQQVRSYFRPRINTSLLFSLSQMCLAARLLRSKHQALLTAPGLTAP